MELAKAQQLAESLMKQHGLIPTIWKFHFDNAKRRFGVCKYSWEYNNGIKQVSKGTISLSKHLVLSNDEIQVKDTILHEIAHALTPGQGHNHNWKRKCIEIGARPERCFSSKDVNTEVVKQLARYQAVCGGCGTIHARHRMMDKTIRRACKCQSGKSWESKIILNYIDMKAV